MKCYLCGKEIKGNIVYVDKMQYPIINADQVNDMFYCPSCICKTENAKMSRYVQVILKEE